MDDSRAKPNGMRKHCEISLDAKRIEQALAWMSLMRGTDPGQYVLRAYLSELCNLDQSQFITEDVTEAMRELGYSERAEGEPSWPVFGTVLRFVNAARMKRIHDDKDAGEEQRITAAVKQTIARIQAQTHKGYEPMTLAEESSETRERAARLQRILDAR